MRNFKSIYRQLKDKKSRETAIFFIKEQLPYSLDFLKLEIDREWDTEAQKELIHIYDDILEEVYPVYLQFLLSKEYASYEEVLKHFSSFIFQTPTYSTQSILTKMTERLIKKLDKKLLSDGSPLEIIQEINSKINKSFLIDNSFLAFYNISDVAKHHTISQYTLSILILAIAEKLKLPIFGIPFEDKLVLVYAQNYCSHNELVFEDDIQYYIVAGEKDLIYTPHDMKLYAALLGQSIDLENILPKSSQAIIQKWVEHLQNCNFDFKTKKYLSSKYQQIFSDVRDFMNF